MLLTLLVTAALAGDLAVQTTLPAELREGGVTLLQTWGPASVRLLGLNAGPHLLEVIAGGKARTLTVNVEDRSVATLSVAAAAVNANTAPPGPPIRPVLELKSASKERFALIVDGERRLVFSDAAAVQVEGLAQGDHEVELRSGDLLTVWARGTLTLGPDTRVVATAKGGVALDVFGPEGAWAPSVGVSPPPGG